MLALFFTYTHTHAGTGLLYFQKQNQATSAERLKTGPGDPASAGRWEAAQPGGSRLLAHTVIVPTSLAPLKPLWVPHPNLLFPLKRPIVGRLLGRVGWTGTHCCI